jgi:Animal haem peroxidase
MRKRLAYVSLFTTLALLAAYLTVKDTGVTRCIAYGLNGPRDVAEERAARFLGKVHHDTLLCRGGSKAARGRTTPWVDWANYWATGDGTSRYRGWLDGLWFLNPNHRGVAGALLDLEYQRIELLKFNLFDNSGTFEEYQTRRSDHHSPERVWHQFRLPRSHPDYIKVGGDSTQQCAGELVRFRTVDGSCNDVLNPLMGATGEPFARNVEFAETFPELGANPLVGHRHGRRIGLLTPDPQVISRKLFTRLQSVPEQCNSGRGSRANSAAAHCDYRKADHLNVLAAFWIQFMTHDWFSHLDEGTNRPDLTATGCVARRTNGADEPLSQSEIDELGCRPDDRIGKAIVAEDSEPRRFKIRDAEYLGRAPQTTPNKVTAWWDASQIYGYDERSRRRLKRDPRDRARLLLKNIPEQAHEALGYLPILDPSDPMHPRWAGQEAVAFPDNWNVGLSFFHNLFAREHNLFVGHFRAIAARSPEADSGLRRPPLWNRPVRYKDVSADELFEVARLVIAAEIAKIHTLEWTTQLLYNEPVYLAMHANWFGLLDQQPLVSAALEAVMQRVATRGRNAESAQLFSAFAAGPGIFGLGNKHAHINAGVNHFGSPFNFPEEFINAYRLHALLPDLIEYRDLSANPNRIDSKIPLASMVRASGSHAMRRRGTATWAVSFGRQRAGKLTLRNHPLFLQNLEMPHTPSPTGKIDVLALDILRDRERGMPRYNEFRRQYGLKQLTSFDDFVDQRLLKNSAERKEQQEIARLLREIYGQHHCDATKIISRAQRKENGEPIDDCLGKAHGAMVDNIEDVDALVGWLAESVRPHGFAISETQFQIFILNASRRLFSDRFFTSSFRPEFYSHLGVEWVNNNGPDGKVIEKGKPNGHTTEVSPLKRVLLRAIPELKAELDPVVNAFDPWARDRGEYYSLHWKPRPGAETDDGFQ